MRRHQYDGQGVYCGMNTASEVFLFLRPNYIHVDAITMQYISYLLLFFFKAVGGAKNTIKVASAEEGTLRLVRITIFHILTIGKYCNRFTPNP